MVAKDTYHQEFCSVLGKGLNVNVQGQPDCFFYKLFSLQNTYVHLYIYIHIYVIIDTDLYTFVCELILVTIFHNYTPINMS